MSASSQADAVRALAGPPAEQAGLVVEDVSITPAGRRRVLRVTVDLPPDRTGGVPMDAVADASRAISEALDGSDVMGGQPYVLEVSSPGVDRPLDRRERWSRARTRRVRVTLADGGSWEGRLLEVDDDGLELDDRRLTWDEVRTGKVLVEFARPDGGPSDEDDAADGADEDDEIEDDPEGDDAEGHEDEEVEV